jgi:CRISPR/Cas system CMR subunit Cmr4 (Cas7 group RAMP superfamily)
MDSPFGPVIDSHTRKDAIAVGDLIPVPLPVASAAGIWWYIALTRAAWLRVGEDHLAGLLAEVHAATKRKQDAISTPAGEFALTWEADAESNLCMTVSLPGED